MARAKRRRKQHFCVGGWSSHADAEADAKIFRKASGKAVVKPAGSGYKVCYTFSFKRRGNVPKHLR